MVVCTRRIAAVSLGIQATSLHTERADHAAWCRPSPHAPRSHIKPLSPLMERRLITGHSPYEAVAGFSRAVVVGDRVHVAGTAPIPPDGAPTPEGAYEQAALCLRLIADALERAGSGLEQVVRTNIYVTAPEHWEQVARAHGEVFRHTRPAATCVVASLLDPAWKVEIEVEATLA